MKDFLGRELEVGDAVVFMEVNRRELKHGTIEKIGKAKATIRYGSLRAYQFPNQIIKVIEHE